MVNWVGLNWVKVKRGYIELISIIGNHFDFDERGHLESEQGLDPWVRVVMGKKEY